MAGSAAAQASYAAGTAEVRLDVQVLRKDRPVTGLEKRDFVVLDEGRQVDVTYFGHQTDPLRVVFLLDMSGSVAKYRAQMAASAEKALALLRPGDRAAILLYGRNTQVYIEMTDDPHDLVRGIQTALWNNDLGSGTSTNQALVAAANYLRQSADKEGQPRARNAILILTDNRGLNYQVPDTRVLQSLYRADVVVNAIVVGGAKPPKPRRDNLQRNPDFTPTNVFLMAEKTGGDAIPSKHADTSFLQLMERIRSRYLLLYRPPDAPASTFRKVEVRLTPEAADRFKKAEVKVREGYYVP